MPNPPQEGAVRPTKLAKLAKIAELARAAALGWRRYDCPDCERYFWVPADAPGHMEKPFEGADGYGLCCPWCAGWALREGTELPTPALPPGRRLPSARVAAQAEMADADDETFDEPSGGKL